MTSFEEMCTIGNLSNINNKIQNISNFYDFINLLKFFIPSLLFS
jgi:hypothetical protein